MTRNLLPLLGVLALAICGAVRAECGCGATIGAAGPTSIAGAAAPGAVLSGPGRHLVCDGELEPAGRDNDHHQLHGQRPHPVDDPESQGMSFMLTGV